MSRLLLDTPVALWWFSGHPGLPGDVRDEIGRSECWLSACSVWEVAIKDRLGKLPAESASLLAIAREAGFRLLAVTPEHAAATARLPDLHVDPFDRLLIAQARHETMTLLTQDAAVARCRRPLWCEYAPWGGRKPRGMTGVSCR